MVGFRRRYPTQRSVSYADLSTSASEATQVCPPVRLVSDLLPRERDSGGFDTEVREVAPLDRERVKLVRRHRESASTSAAVDVLTNFRSPQTKSETSL